MSKRTKEKWLSLFQQHQDSTLSASQFCKQNNLCPKYFSLRKKQLAWTAEIKPTGFINATIPRQRVKSAVSPVIQLTHNNIQLTLPTSINEQWLANLIKTLNA